MSQIPALVQLKDVSVKLNGADILKNIDLTIEAGQQWAIVGRSGSGKTTLAQALAGRTFHAGTIEWQLYNHSHAHRILLIEQQHKFKNRTNASDIYYQQRYNSLNSEDTITVMEALQETRAARRELEISHPGNGSYKRPDPSYWLEQLNLQPLLAKSLVMLSNGENKRLQLARALLLDPAVLVLDNPFTGLDVDGRETLHNILNKIVEAGISIILITPPQDLPDCITHVAVLEGGSVVSATEKASWEAAGVGKIRTIPLKTIKKLQPLEVLDDFEIAVLMKDVVIRYGEKTVLDRVNWEVKKGECWSLSGPNGAGKSTVLSLITADNPQAYANEIYLFDKRRGSGESIWDIKKRIGFVSPELHVYFDRGTSCFDVIASGLFDTIGLFKQLTAAQQERVAEWIKLLQLEALARKPLFQLSLGQQRMVLLARALVKNPPVLILDEPCQGLDEEQVEYFKKLIDKLCDTFDTTLIFVSHYKKDIPSCVTKAAYIEEGRLTVK